MHREISHTDSTFSSESPLPLYLFTGLIATLVGLDVGPRVALWLGMPELAPWPSEVGGYRFALVAAVVGGARVLYGSLQSLLDGRLGADLALAIACLAAILMNEPLVAAEVVFVGLLGECLEAFTFERTQRSVRKIVEVFPLRCWRVRDGVEERVFTRDLVVGDRVAVKPGAKIPVDGVVTSGRSSIDASRLTGESVPIDKGQGDEVLAGSLNQHGALEIEARKVAEQTVAGRVIELTARALRDKTSGERLADRLARAFLPAVLGLAGLTFVVGMAYYGWFRSPRMSGRAAMAASLYPTLSVLVVACPCALILATPAAVLAAIGRLAGTGVLIKRGSAFEKLATITALALDKTGTLTEGRLTIREVQTLGDVGEDTLVRLAASAEAASEHPLARAVLAEALRRGLTAATASEFHASPGGGVRARADGVQVVVGTRRHLEDQGVAWPTSADAIGARFDASGQTPLWVARDGVVLGGIGAQDTPRPEAAGVVEAFRSLGMNPIVVLTGDRSAPAQAAARDLGLADLHAELLPHQKAERVASLQAGGAKVAMIGDGINDAPALARADVGLAIGGVDVTAEAGDVVLMGDPLRALPLLFRLSRQTVAIIRQNILWYAFGVNAVGIVGTAWLWPLFAPAGWVEQSPLAAVIYHQLGSLAVLLNSMRLLWFERPSERAMRWKGRLRTWDLWFEKAFDGHEWSHWLYERRRRVGLALALIAGVAYAATGFTIVAPEEQGVTLRFGAPVATLTPGWHWRWPAGMERTVRVSDRVRFLDVGFRETPENLGRPGSWTWTSAHRKENRRQEESMMITGDGNLVDVQAVVRYRAADAQRFLFASAGIEEILRAETESTLRALVAGRAFHELLTEGRASFESAALAWLREAIGARESSLGIAIDGLSLIDLHPPGEVVQSYYAVAIAMEGRDRRINEAKERAHAKAKASDAQATRIVSLARALAVEQTMQAEAEATRFLEVAKVRRASPEDAALSDFRRFWDVVGKALAGRDLVLVDREKLPGSRTLFLVDPELFRPSLMLPPDRRQPPPRSPIEEP